MKWFRYVTASGMGEAAEDEPHVVDVDSDMVDNMSEGDKSDVKGQPKRRRYREFNEVELCGTMHIEIVLKFQSVEIFRQDLTRYVVQ